MRARYTLGPQFDPHRAAIRARGHKVTPYRLGLESGFRLDDLPNPYMPGSRGYDSFRDGVRYEAPLGRALRADLLAWLKSTGSAA